MQDEEFESWVQSTGASVKPGNAAAAKQPCVRFVGLAQREQSEIRRLLESQ